MSKHGGDIISGILGSVSALAGQVVGLFAISTLAQAFILGFIGAVGGYLAKKTLDHFFKRKQ